MKYLIILMFPILFGCDTKKAQEIKKSSNPDYEIYTLFEHEGCKVYGFYDGGREHYFTNCTETISTQKVLHGKTTTTYNENIGGKK